jgi:ATP synthase protein I
MDATPGTTRASGVTLLLRSSVVTLVLGGLLAVVGALVAGSSAALGALVGTGLVVAVCAGGSLLVNAVAGVLPSASLMVALLTYTLQVLLLLVAFVALERSGLLGGALDRIWVGGAAIAATLQWLVAQVVLTFRSRIPAFDLPPEGGER